MELLQNPWVVGIGGGIASSLIVFFLTRWLFSNTSKRELARKATAANQEIVLAVRQGIPEGKIPTFDVLEALIKATARKHGMLIDQLYGPQEVAQDLIKEVMDSSFISAQTKEDYCARLAELDEPEEVPTEAEVIAKQATLSAWVEARSSLATSAGAILALVAGLTTVMFQLFEPIESAGLLDLTILLPILIISLSVALVVGVSGFFSGRANAMRRDIEKKSISAQAWMGTSEKPFRNLSDEPMAK